MSKTIEQGKDEVAKLCNYFTTNKKSFIAPGVKEDHVRQSLIDPFFQSLGWDVRNTALVAPQYREVITEDSLDVEGQQKAPDYTFRVGQTNKFYAEAKKCGVNIHADPNPAFQLRRYGWNGRTAVSILTDFEELSVYDCASRPRPSDKASHARILYFSYNEYPDRWRELWNVFSREAVWSGAFDQYTASKRKRGTSEVDGEFLKEIEGWRKALAVNIALRNKDISIDDLKAAVQLTIDRIVFLRMAEDRGIETYEQLLKLCERPNIYARFMSDLCHRADKKYNSGLFHFQKEAGVSEAPDINTPALSVDDKVLKPIIESLYFAHGSPYHFGVLPVEILGTVYERFLGKVIRLTSGNHAKIEEKPEVRKAGGVYYTPAYIVDHIVKQTVGKLIEGRSPAKLAGGKDKPSFRILDMACGSGSFLLGAYKCLLDFYLKWYIDHKPEAHKKAVYKDPRSGHWRLTIEEKKRILTTHIFGVDIDPQAVEVTKLSLLLKVLEGETDQSINLGLLPFSDRALPNLADNIKCGNSLIGTKYFTGLRILDPDEMKRINPFDWMQGFPDAMNAGGFDCVIGNPPYVLLQTLDNKEVFDYLATHYLVAKYKIDTYHLFLESAVNLTRKDGRFGFIVPNTFLRNQHARSLRHLLLNNSEINVVRLFNYNVFEDASVDTAVLVCSRRDRPSDKHIVHVDLLSSPGANPQEQTVKQKDWSSHPKKEFALSGGRDAEAVLQRMASNSILLGEIATAYFGIQTFDRKKFVTNHRRSSGFMPVIDGANINRYSLSASQEYVDFRRTAIKSGGKQSVYLIARIGVRQIGKTPVATLIPKNLYTLNTIYNIFFTGETKYDLRFILGIIASRASRFYWERRFFDQKKTFPKIKKPDLLAIPIPRLNFNESNDKACHDKMVQQVDSMLDLNKFLNSAKSESQKGIIQRQIDATDAEIDRLVYKLYGLTADEIAIVEGKA